MCRLSLSDMRTLTCLMLWTTKGSMKSTRWLTPKMGEFKLSWLGGQLEKCCQGGLGSFDHTSSTSWQHQQWPFGQDGEEFKDSLGIKGDEVENFQNCLLVSLFLLMKYGCHVQVGIELLCKWFSNPSCDLFHPGFRYTGKSAKENSVSHCVLWKYVSHQQQYHFCFMFLPKG